MQRLSIQRVFDWQEVIICFLIVTIQIRNSYAQYETDIENLYYPLNKEFIILKHVPKDTKIFLRDTDGKIKSTKFWNCVDVVVTIITTENNCEVFSSDDETIADEMETQSLWWVQYWYVCFCTCNKRRMFLSVT